MSCHFWIDTMSKEKLDAEIMAYIEKNMYLAKEPGGYLTYDVYVDYDDELFSDDLKKIFNSETPMDTFLNVVDDVYDGFEEKDWIANEIKKNFSEEYHEYITSWVDENVFPNAPYEHFLKQEVCVDITVDTGDANYDFTLNSLESGNISGLASTVWLARQQGYTLSDIKLGCGREADNEFLKSLYAEYDEECSAMNALTFLVRMPLRQALEILDAKQKLKRSMTEEEKYRPSRNRNGSFIVLSENTEVGLIDFWNGSGSSFGIRLEKDVVLPLKYIYNIYPDECYKYGFMNIYGCSKIFFRPTLKDIKLYGAAK